MRKSKETIACNLGFVLCVDPAHATKKSSFGGYFGTLVLSPGSPKVLRDFDGLWLLVVFSCEAKRLTLIACDHG